MESLSKIGRYEFVAEPFHCDFSKRLFLGHLGNHLLNAADFHSGERGFGMTYLNLQHKTWVLSRLAVEMDEMPQSYDRFYVETWVEGAMRYFTSRDFAITNADGKTYGYGRSIWALIDTDTRQPTDILSVKDGAITQYVETEKSCPMDKGSRVKMGQKAELVRTLDTYYHDVDVNGHVNSVKYIEHVLDLFPLDYYRTHKLRRFDIAYVAETYQGDQLHIYRERVGEAEDYQFRVTKTTSDSQEETEVVRCEVKFI
ncbi:MAG TPA: acyl-[acyl-carrier-protein] thioesterase [Candidatus Prevotella avicola]|uniref:Acyl-[acyl-carrier-protein] thioesterase n=1 Tax=Candidatus Prevotella avicola TaxID=2838738 RepID=A0A9D2JWE6_9BACT|nr:acyl-[acyl-carrier-protein] thioesterase [Candidatus Prevotella avicola]